MKAHHDVIKQIALKKNNNYRFRVATSLLFIVLIVENKPPLFLKEISLGKVGSPSALGLSEKGNIRTNYKT